MTTGEGGGGGGGVREGEGEGGGGEHGGDKKKKETGYIRFALAFLVAAILYFDWPINDIWYH